MEFQHFIKDIPFFSTPEDRISSPVFLLINEYCKCGAYAGCASLSNISDKNPESRYPGNINSGSKDLIFEKYENERNDRRRRQ
jgi:hypothetical protein